MGMPITGEVLVRPNWFAANKLGAEESTGAGADGGRTGATCARASQVGPGVLWMGMLGWVSLDELAPPPSQSLGALDCKFV